MLDNKRKLSRYHDTDYLFLIKEWQSRGLSSEQLMNLIKANKLDQRYEVCLSDVRKDIDELEIHVKRNNSKSSVVPNIYYINDNTIDYDKYEKEEIEREEKIKNERKRIIISDPRYVDGNYMKLIELWSRYPKAYTDEKLKNLIHANKFDIHYGVTVHDVRIDINNYDYIIAQLILQNNKSKQTDDSGVSGSKKMHQNRMKTAINYAGDTGKKNVKSNVKERKTLYDNEKNTLTENDKRLVNEIFNAFTRYPELLLDNKLIKNLLSDVIPENKLELNILKTLIDCNILKEIDKCDILDNSLRHRFVKKLSVEYGIAELQADRVVLICIYAYGKNYLNKELM